MTYLDDDFDWSGGMVENYKHKNKKMNKIKDAIGWMVWSSSNSEKISLTLKAGIPFLILLGIGDTQTLNDLMGTIGNFIVSGATVITGAITIWGLVRKIWNSFE